MPRHDLPWVFSADEGSPSDVYPMRQCHGLPDRAPFQLLLHEGIEASLAISNTAQSCPEMLSCMSSTKACNLNVAICRKLHVDPLCIDRPLEAMPHTSEGPGNCFTASRVQSVPQHPFKRACTTGVILYLAGTRGLQDVTMDIDDDFQASGMGVWRQNG